MQQVLPLCQLKDITVIIIIIVSLIIHILHLTFPIRSRRFLS